MFDMWSASKRQKASKQDQIKSEQLVAKVKWNFSFCRCFIIGRSSVNIFPLFFKIFRLEKILKIFSNGQKIFFLRSSFKNIMGSQKNFNEDLPKISKRFLLKSFRGSLKKSRWDLRTIFIKKFFEIFERSQPIS